MSGMPGVGEDVTNEKDFISVVQSHALNSVWERGSRGAARNFIWEGGINFN